MAFRKLSGPIAARLFAAALCVAAARAQDAASANVKFELLNVSGGAAVMASGTKSAVITLDPTAGTMSSAGVVAELGLAGATGVNAFSGPQIVDVSPPFGACSGGELVRIRGFNFNQGGMGASLTVKVGAAPAFLPSSVTDQEIFFITPPGNPGLAAVRVTTNFGSIELPGMYEFVCPGGPPATLFSISPAVGDLDGGTTVTLTGLSFLPGSTVLFDGAPASNVTIVNAQTLTCRTPAHVAGYATPTVVNSGGAASLPLGFEYKAYAKVTNLGGGCPGVFGFPQNFLGGNLPVVGGGAFNMILAAGKQNSPAGLVLGPEVPGGWLVVGTTCLAFVDPLDFLFFPTTSSPFGTAFMTFQVPYVPELIGYSFASQWFVIDEAGAAGIFSMTNALRLRLGIAP
jgi:hypothetical protein